MTIAYIISAYKYPEQLIRLVSRLNSGSAHFFIHVDKKTPRAVYAQAIGGLKAYPNVCFLPRHRCYWGGFGHVRATLKGIDEIARRGLSPDYVVLLTGQDYPVKTNRRIETFLEQSGGRSYMEYLPLPCEAWPGSRGRMEHWHIRVYGRHLTIRPVHHGVSSLRRLRNWPSWLVHRVLPSERRLPNGLKPFGGSSYWCLSGECVDYIRGYAKAHPEYVRYFKYVDVPDEHFFHTLLLNSPFGDSIVNDDLRYADWSAHGPNPSILRSDNFDALAQTGDLFARKFDATVDHEILDIIDERILGLAEPSGSSG